MNIELVPIDGGVRVKETATHYIDVMEQLYNWRIVLTPKSCPLVWDRGWCYSGKDSFIPAVLAAYAWDGHPDSEPAGWNKNIQTGEWRPPGIIE